MVKDIQESSANYTQIKQKEITFLKERNFAIIKSNLSDIEDVKRSIMKKKKENNRLYKSNDWLSTL